MSDQMQLEQGIFTSTRTNRMQGYHLVSRTSGIGEGTVRSVTRWAPSHAGLISRESNHECVSFCPLDGEQVALFRSFYGGPEYSDRGGLQVVTRILVLLPNQLEGYDYNPLRLLRRVLSYGLLRFESSFPQQLPQAEIPAADLNTRSNALVERTQLAETILGHIMGSERVAVVSCQDPESLLSEVLDSLPAQRRTALSFTTGLKPSLNRPFQLQIFSDSDSDLKQQLESHEVVILEAADH